VLVLVLVLVLLTPILMVLLLLMLLLLSGRGTFRVLSSAASLVSSCKVGFGASKASHTLPSVSSRPQSGSASRFRNVPLLSVFQELTSAR
jgi:hypothetical protein